MPGKRLSFAFQGKVAMRRALIGLRLPLALGSLNLSILEIWASDPCSLTIRTHPISTTVPESRRAVFTVEVGGPEPYFLQWFRDNAAIPGATNLCYTTPRIRVGDSGSLFWVAASNAECQVSSSHAQLTISLDIVSPELVEVAAIAPRQIALFFTKEVAPGSPDNYSLIPPQRVSAVSANQSDPTVVRLTLSADSPLTPGTRCALTVGGVRDLSGNALHPSPSSREFVVAADIGDSPSRSRAVLACGKVLIIWPVGDILWAADQISGPWSPPTAPGNPIVLDTAETVCPTPPRFYRSAQNP